MNLTDLTDLLARAKNRITSGWTQGARARDANGNVVDPISPDARSWDMTGAVVAERPIAMLPIDIYNLQSMAKKALTKAIDNNPLAWWNDAADRSREDIVSVFDKAIRMADTMTQPPPEKPWWQRAIDYVKSVFDRCR